MGTPSLWTFKAFRRNNPRVSIGRWWRSVHATSFPSGVKDQDLGEPLEQLFGTLNTSPRSQRAGPMSPGPKTFSDQRSSSARSKRAELPRMVDWMPRVAERHHRPGCFSQYRRMPSKLGGATRPRVRTNESTLRSLDTAQAGVARFTPSPRGRDPHRRRHPTSSGAGGDGREKTITDRRQDLSQGTSTTAEHSCNRRPFA